jgi:hypothetical protein
VSERERHKWREEDNIERLKEGCEDKKKCAEKKNEAHPLKKDCIITEIFVVVLFFNIEI